MCLCYFQNAFEMFVFVEAFDAKLNFAFVLLHFSRRKEQQLSRKVVVELVKKKLLVKALLVKAKVKEKAESKHGLLCFTWTFFNRPLIQRT